MTTRPLKPWLLGSCTAAVLAGMAFPRDTREVDGTSARVVAEVEDRNPWTSLNLNNSDQVFRFAIVGDRTGGHRQGVFARAVDQLNLLQPEFVMSVGDLIEGGPDAKALAAEWREFQGMVGRLQMPFFYVPGNHDYQGTAAELVWKQRFGRSYYHFAYRRVLFLILNPNIPNEKGGLGRQQVEYARRVLRQHQDAPWTFVFLHQALWDDPAFERGDWEAVERELNGRRYTVFCGHGHQHYKWVRHGMNYYMMGATGAANGQSGPEYGHIDHVAQVTMKPDGPVVCNLLLNGILPDDLIPTNPSESAGSGYDRAKMPWPRIEIDVTIGGEPAAGKLVSLHSRRPDGKLEPMFFGYVGADGVVVPWIERQPARRYLLTIAEYDGRLDGKAAGVAARALRSPKAPARYADPAMSGLEIDVKGTRDTVNRFRIDLKSEPTDPLPREPR